MSHPGLHHTKCPRLPATPHHHGRQLFPSTSPLSPPLAFPGIMDLTSDPGDSQFTPQQTQHHTHTQFSPEEVYLSQNCTPAPTGPTATTPCCHPTPLPSFTTDTRRELPVRMLTPFCTRVPQMPQAPSAPATSAAPDVPTAQPPILKSKPLVDRSDLCCMQFGSPSTLLITHTIHRILSVHCSRAPFLTVKIASTIRDRLAAQYVFITFPSPAYATTQAVVHLMSCGLNVIINAAPQVPLLHLQSHPINQPTKDKPWQMPSYCIVNGCSHGPGPGADGMPSFPSQQDLRLHLEHFHEDMLAPLLSTSPREEAQDNLGLNISPNHSCVQSIFCNDLFLEHQETWAAGAASSTPLPPPPQPDPPPNNVHMHPEDIGHPC